MANKKQAEVIIVGGGLAGHSAAVYIGRARHSVLIVDSGKSMARWEPHVQNYLGFPDGVGGPELVERARRHAQACGAKIIRDEILRARKEGNIFRLRGRKAVYTCERLLIATGIFHIPPDIPGLNACLGHSMFFCKDCDGLRVQGKDVGVFGWTDEAVEYALGMVLYSPKVFILTNGHTPRWSRRSVRYVEEYHIPVYRGRITDVEHEDGVIGAVHMGRKCTVEIDALFTTRGDIYYNKLAKSLGAKIDSEGAIKIDSKHRTSVRGLFAAGCVTPANCQMIIAAGEGAAAGQAINRDLFEQGLRTHSLRLFRKRQVRTQRILPKIRGRKRVVLGEDPTAAISR